MLTLIEAEKNEAWQRLNTIKGCLAAAMYMLPGLDQIGDPELTLDIARARNTVCEVMANVELDLEQGRDVKLP